MKILLSLLMFFTSIVGYSQLGFCSGSKGDPIFHEDFGQGSGTGDPLAPGITNYNFVRQDPQDGEYTISSTIGNYITSWHSYLPNTNISGGRALIVNADFNPGRFYRKEISGLCENTTYEFSAFLMNIYNRSSTICPNGGIPNNVRFEIWDETDSYIIKSGDTPMINSTSNPVWDRFALTFKSQSGQGSVILKMFNNGEGGCGNDLAIDDIIFRSCGDLTTITTEENEDSLTICQQITPVQSDLQANSDGSVYEDPFFQWQQSFDGDNWTNIPGATSASFKTSLIEETRYFRVKVAEDQNNLNNNVCSSASEAFIIEVISTPDAPQSNGDVQVCENDVFPSISVTVEEDESVDWYDANGNLVAENSPSYFPEEQGIFYAEARKEGYECGASERTAVNFTVNPVPDLDNENLEICPESNLILDTGLNEYEFSWSTGENTSYIEVNSPGQYSVEVITPEGCITTKEFSVTPVSDAQIEQVISEGENVKITPVTEGEFQYSLDGVNYQDFQTFNSVAGGIYTAYIRDLASCNIDTFDFAHIVVPKMISPNGDGYNDNFELKGVEFFGKSEILIFDRYGKILKAGSGAGFQWNGKFNGIDLPADDYWCLIKISGFPDQTVHFSLIR
ncbi:T9SS type B sorting domain-containing protein [Gramella sp. MT6]|uniref:T9SS type B sorting domain-containing protein n=1 Tax=Gramella sp. MT6 TaxID=2705471 RepID=UPI001C5E02AB|nr:T9SS type B sorting domain-containing protein [Gramella sp. MT6]QYA26514.1 T9SS type B sorting domain-containing protein [Gramella sp. MT6]